MPRRGMNVVAFDPAEIRRLVPWSVLVEALRQMFATGCHVPPRQHHDVPVPGGETGSLLLMPAWRSGHYLGVKVVGVFPGNGALGKPTISGLFVLADANTGEIVAHFDGAELTSRRTAAASALAASYLARHDARRMVVIGTGRMSRNLAQAYCAVRPIEEIQVYGRSVDKVKKFIGDLEFLPVRIDMATDLPAALREADIVTSATLATEPIIHGRNLPDGIHVDLVGGFRSDMREADDDVIKRVSSVFVDTREGAFKEAGDIMQPIAAGILTKESVAGDLAGLCRGEHPGRTHEAEITLFKSVGTAPCSGSCHFPTILVRAIEERPVQIIKSARMTGVMTRAISDTSVKKVVSIMQPAGERADSHRLNFGQRVKQLRAERQLTGVQLSELSNIAASTLSKIEGNRLSPTYDTIMKLAHGLGVNVEQLFSDSVYKDPVGRRSITRSGQGTVHSSPAYDYEMLCSDISNKKLIPIVGHLKAHSRREFGNLITHDGEEVIYVLSGRVELHTEFYKPLVLDVGDCVFFDSRMGHACIATGDTDAKVLWVCSDRAAIDVVQTSG